MYDELVKRLRDLQFITEHCGEQSCGECENRELCDKYDNKTLSGTYKEAVDAIVDLQKLIDAQLGIIKQYQEYLGKTRWIKFALRPLTEEEQREHPDWCYILDCQTPDDGQEILASDGRYVWTDTFYQDGDMCYLDGDAELESCWWQPLPQPPKEE